MPGPEFDKYEKSTIVEETKVQPSGKVEKVQREKDMWEQASEHMDCFPGWEESPSGQGLTVISRSGTVLRGRNSMLSGMKNGGVFVFSEERKNPFWLKLDGHDNLLVSRYPVDVEDILTLPNKPQNPEDEPVLPTENPNKAELKDGEETISNLKINEIGVSDEDLKFVNEVSKAVPLQLPTKYFGKSIPQKLAPEEITEDYMPPEPKPLTKREARWDNFVKFFNKKGSAKGQAFRAAEKNRHDAIEAYPKWRDEYNKTFKLKEAEPAKRAADMDKMMQITSKPEFNAALNMEAKKAAYEKDINKYHKKLRSVFSDNPAAAYIDIKKNGLTIDNCGAYLKILEKGLENKPLTEETKMAAAEYLLMKKINDDITEHIDYNLKNNVTNRFDLRDSTMLLDIMSNPEKKQREIKNFMQSPSFKDTMKALSFSEKISTKDIASEYENSRLAAPMQRFESREKGLLQELSEKPIGKNSEELLVKFCMLKDTRESFRVSSNMMSMFMGDDASVQKGMKQVSTEMAKIDVNYKRMFQRYKELSDKGVKPLEKINPVKLKDLDGQIEGLEMNQAYVSCKRYQQVLKNHPEIKNTINKFMGQKVTPSELLNELTNPQKAISKEAAGGDFAKL